MSDMSAELKDIRTKVALFAWCFLEAESRATGRDLSEVVRDILHDWAGNRDCAHRVAQRLLRSEGISGKDGD